MKPILWHNPYQWFYLIQLKQQKDLSIIIKLEIEYKYKLILYIFKYIFNFKIKSCKSIILETLPYLIKDTREEFFNFFINEILGALNDSVYNNFISLKIN